MVVVDCCLLGVDCCFLFVVYGLRAFVVCLCVRLVRCSLFVVCLLMIDCCLFLVFCF